MEFIYRVPECPENPEMSGRDFFRDIRVMISVRAILRVRVIVRDRVKIRLRVNIRVTTSQDISGL